LKTFAAFVTVGGQASAKQESPVLVASAAVQVFDQLRKPIQGASVKWSASRLQIPARETDSREYVAFSDVRPGKYRLEIRFAGFKSLEREIEISTADKRAGHLLAVMLLVPGGCLESRLCPMVGSEPLEIAPLCVISPNPY
jgi:hypothetical protein